MPYITQINHLDRVRNMIAGKVVHPGAERLASSYRRSLIEHRLDPASTSGPRILTAPQLRQLREQEETFLRSTGQCLPRLHDMVRDAGYCVILADARGVTIDYQAERDQRKSFQRAGLYPGSCWSEQEEGTCGIASVLQDQAPITVHKSDHFRAAFTSLTCSAAPIFAPGGELIGVLDASALRSPDERDSQRLVSQLVRQSATLIEDGFFLKSYGDCWILLAHRNRHFVEVQPESLIAVDGNGMLLAANRHARGQIAALAQLPRPVGEVFDVKAERLFDTRPGQNLLSLRQANGGAWLHARIRAPLKQPRGRQAPAPTSIVADAPLDHADAAERLRIVQALGDTRWHAPQAAALLGMSRATLYRRLKRLRILPPHRA